MNKNQTIVAAALKSAGFHEVSDLAYVNASNSVVVGLGRTGTTVNIGQQTYKFLTSTLAAMETEELVRQLRETSSE